ncbi:MAG: flagellar export protein FliJ [Gemmatimonadaceae bacterium]
MSTGRFTFRLQRLLGLRQMAERAAAISLGAAQQVASTAHAAEARVAGQRAGARAAMLPASGSTQRVAELCHAAFLMEQLDAHVVNAGANAVAADATVRETRDRLGTRVKERRILERLRERHVAEWSLHTERQERELMDAIPRLLPVFGDGLITPSDD